MKVVGAMATPPPLPPQIPPKLQAIPPVLRQSPAADHGSYLTYCSYLCFGMAGLILLGGLVVGIEKANQGGEDLLVFIFGMGVVVLAAGAGVLLRRGRRLGHPLAMICFVMMLIGFPLGTALGIMGIMWLNKSQHLLE
jgi:hypothetical protein